MPPIFLSRTFIDIGGFQQLRSYIDLYYPTYKGIGLDQEMPEYWQHHLEGWEENGHVFLQDGRLYVSPNCKRPVVIPPEPQYTVEPFPEALYLEYSKFKQPVWWNDSYGWLSFTPLSPTFLPSPFAALCWSPRIIEIAHKGKIYHQIIDQDVKAWLHAEKCLIEAVMKLRVAYKIPGNLPPVPSLTLFHCPSPSRARLMRAIQQTRDWFMIWMGMFSYIIGQIAVGNPTDWKQDIPCWYYHLFESGTLLWPESWLNGLCQSTVATFDTNTQHAGVILRWSNVPNMSSLLELFLEHYVPLFYPWTIDEERAVSTGGLRRDLVPPAHMIQNVFTLLYKSPSPPLAALIVSNYLGIDTKKHVLLDNTSYRKILRQANPIHPMRVFIEKSLCHDEILDLLKMDPVRLWEKLIETNEEEKKRVKALAVDAAEVPMEGMLEEDSETRAQSTLVADVIKWFEERDSRTEELIQEETPEEQNRRLNRERSRGVNRAEVFVWSKVVSSGGKEIYLRTRVAQRWKQSELENYPPLQTRYNAYFNQWDLCEFLDPESQVLGHYMGDSDSDVDDLDIWSPTSQDLFSSVNTGMDTASADNSSLGSTVALSSNSQPLSEMESFSTTVPPISPTPSSSCLDPLRPPPPSTDIELDDAWELCSSDFCSQGHILETAGNGYGFVPNLVSNSMDMPLVDLDKWKLLMKNWGYLAEESDNAPRDGWSPSLLAFYTALAKSKTSEPDIDLYDLNPENRFFLAHVFDFSLIQRPAKNLYVFTGPQSKSVKWLLGVEIPEAALYIMRFILAHRHHNCTMLTIAKQVISRGIPCRTLIKKDSTEPLVTISKKYNTHSFRKVDHIFTGEDFKAWGSQTRELLRRPQGRAAILKGGIVGAIARNFLGIDDAFAGPSAEVECGIGFVCPSDQKGSYYMDDELTEDEIALICGINTLYECKSFLDFVD